MDTGTRTRMEKKLAFCMLMTQKERRVVFSVAAPVPSRQKSTGAIYAK
jgi:hypothetical protein